MLCQIVPDHILLKVAGSRKGANKLDILNEISKSAGFRAKRKTVFANRKLLNKAIVNSANISMGSTQRVRAPVGLERLHFYDCKSRWDFPSTPAQVIETKHSKDKPLPRLLKRQHIENMDETYDFFRDVYRRKSFDRKSATVKFFANYGSNYGNAFWDGERMVFGLGDEYVNDLGAIFDIVVHEYTHAVEQYESGLEYQGQSGAICESLADVFGSVAKQYLLNQTVDQADWLVGQGMWNTNTLGTAYKALRSMSAPGTAFPQDDQPSHMDNYYPGSEDNFGVHINSGIPNKAFCIFATELGGKSWEIAGKVWYKAMSDQRSLKFGADFGNFSKATITACKRISPDNVTVLKESWYDVGVT